MDKYFSESYDPRLDLPEVPKTGMLHDGEHGGWDQMLSVVAERSAAREARKDKERREKDERRRERQRTRDEREAKRRWKARAGIEGSEEEEDRRRRREKKERTRIEGEEREKSLMGMKYTKPGGVREWDQAKDVSRFT